MTEKKDMIAVWFSCGAASAVAAKLTLEKYGKEYNVRVLNNPVDEEHEDNRRFMADVQEWLGVEIETVSHPAYSSAVDVWEDRGFMSGPKGAPCTTILKKNARKKWEIFNQPTFHVMGFCAGEEGRHKQFLQERPNTLPVLIDAGMTKEDCFRYLSDEGLELPEVYHLGFPNANCIGCVKASSPTYWNHVRKHFPEIFEERARQSREIGARLVRVKGERIFLDELDPAAKGRPLKGMDISCSIFCK